MNPSISLQNPFLPIKFNHAISTIKMRWEQND